VLATSTKTKQVANTSIDWEKFLSALKKQETGTGSGLGVTGDNGKAYGPLQIHEGCFKDAQRFDSSLKDHTWQECLNDLELSKRVARAYISHYMAKGCTVGDMAGIWNGGPKGASKESTSKYRTSFLKIYSAKS
jgi:hypothetical protein